VKAAALLVSSLSLLAAGLCACDKGSRDGAAQALTPQERALVDSLRFDPGTVQRIKDRFASEVVRMTAPEQGGLGSGVMFRCWHEASDLRVEELAPPLRSEGYTLFVRENNFGIQGRKDDVALLKDTSLAGILKAVGTDGANYGIDNDSVIAIARSFASRYPLRLNGAALDWVSFRIEDDVDDWNALAAETARLAPDIVEQGTGSVAELAKVMMRTRTLYMWWD